MATAVLLSWEATSLPLLYLLLYKVQLLKKAFCGSESRLFEEAAKATVVLLQPYQHITMLLLFFNAIDKVKWSGTHYPSIYAKDGTFPPGGLFFREYWPAHSFICFFCLSHTIYFSWFFGMSLAGGMNEHEKRQGEDGRLWWDACDVENGNGNEKPPNSKISSPTQKQLFFKQQFFSLLLGSPKVFLGSNLEVRQNKEMK